MVKKLIEIMKPVDAIGYATAAVWVAAGLAAAYCIIYGF